jgi:hypothetical protein
MSNTSAGNIPLCRGQHNCNMLPASDWLSGSPERVRHASSEFGAKLIMDRTKSEIKIDPKKSNVANVKKREHFQMYVRTTNR